MEEEIVLSSGWILARGPTLPLTLLSPEARARKNDDPKESASGGSQISQKKSETDSTLCYGFGKELSAL